VDAGLDIAAVAATNLITEDAEFRSAFVTLEDSGIKAPDDLSGKTIGVISPNDTTMYWALAALEGAGLSAEDASFVSVPPTSAEEALRGGQVDVAFIPNTFIVAAMGRGGLKIVFDAYSAVGFEHLNLSMFMSRTFVEEHPEAFCAWRSDFQSATEAFVDKRALVGDSLIEAKRDPAPDGEAFAKRPHTGVSPGGVIDLEGVRRLMSNMTEIGFLESLRIDENDVVLQGYSLTE
jgi:hypothetical protein